MTDKLHLRCECGRPYPKKLAAQAFWTPAADAELMRLRNQGMSYRDLAVEINKRHAVKVSSDQTYHRHIALCQLMNIARPSAGRARTRPSKPEPLYAAVKTHSNQCAALDCSRQRANGYDKCLAHLPPLEITKGETT